MTATACGCSTNASPRHPSSSGRRKRPYAWRASTRWPDSRMTGGKGGRPASTSSARTSGCPTPRPRMPRARCRHRPTSQAPIVDAETVRAAREEREVRHTVIRLVGRHLRPAEDDATSVERLRPRLHGRRLRRRGLFGCDVQRRAGVLRRGDVQRRGCGLRRSDGQWRASVLSLPRDVRRGWAVCPWTGTTFRWWACVL